MTPRLWSVFGVAFTARALFVWGQTTFRWFDIGFVAGDSGRYLYYARALLDGSFLVGPDGVPTAAVTPGYPLFLAALFAVGITDPLWIGIVQCALGAATCVFIAIIAEAIAGRRAGTIAGLLAAVYPHFIFWNGYILTETLYLFLVAAALVLLVRLERHAVVSLAIGCGLAIGAAAMVRTTAAPLAALAPAWLLWVHRSNPWRGGRLAVVTVLASAVILGAWMVRNIVQMGAPVVLSTQGGIVLYHGFSPGATGGSRGYVDDRDYVPLTLPPGLSEVDQDRYYRREALEFIREHTRAVPRLAFWKLVNMYRPAYADASVANMLVLGGSYVGLVFLFAVGCLRGLRLAASVPVFQLALLFLGMQVAQYAFTIGMIRFRLASEMIFVVVGAAALVPARIWQEHRDRRVTEGFEGGRDPAAGSPESVGVLQIITRLNIGGTSQHVVSLAEGFHDPPFRSHLIVGKPNLSEGDMTPHLRMERLHCTVVPRLGRELRPLSDALAWLGIFRIVRDERPAIIHTHTAKAGTIGRTAAVVHNLVTRLEGHHAARRCRVVHTFHGHVLQGYFGGWKTRLYRVIEHVLARVTDRIIVVSEAVGDDLLRLGVGSPESIRVIKLGIPLDDLLRLPPPAIDPITFIGSVGRLVPIKNHEMLLAAARRCVDDPALLNLRFRIVGDGELRPTLERQVREHGLEHSIRFDGWCHDVAGVYAHIDAVCLTSRAEGTPVSVIEALAAARPAIVTDVGGVRDLMGAVNGRVGPVEIAEHGLIVQPNDVDGLVIALRFLVEHPARAREMGAIGRRAVEQHYTTEQLIRNTRACYEELLPDLNADAARGSKLVPFGISGGGAAGRVP